jgi:hypothetical protein
MQQRVSDRSSARPTAVSRINPTAIGPSLEPDGVSSRALASPAVGVRGYQDMAGFLAFLALAGLLGWIVFGRAAGTPQLLMPLWAMIFLSFVTPMTIIAIRHQVRLTRVKLINLFARNFGFDASLRKLPKGEKALRDADISFEFVKGKYYADLNIREDQEPKLDDIPRFPMMLHADWMLLFCALPFMIFSGFGMFILFAPVSELITIGKSISSWLYPSVLLLGGSERALLEFVTDPTERMYSLHVNMLTVAAMAFAGAYFYTLRLLLRAVAVFDLSSITFLRCFAHMVLAVTLAVVIFRIWPSMDDLAPLMRRLPVLFGELPSDRPAFRFTDPRNGINPIWLLLAFVLGFVPDSALQYVLQRSGVVYKEPYRLPDRHSKTVPLTIIDGIDPMMAFRLEEANIYDVQNLATFNPIMLHIESPYGIYETMDWVAQAQLCNVVGPDRFLLLKTLNIRTIFDLQHAVLDPQADAWLQLEIGKAILGDNLRDKAMRHDFGFGAGVLEGASTPLTVAAVQHMTRVMLDDLHVHRLRQTWLRIAGRLAGEQSVIGAAGARLAKG